MLNFKLFGCLICLSLLLLACGAEPQNLQPLEAPTVAETPTETATAVPPTLTPEPTNTPKPTPLHQTRVAEAIAASGEPAGVELDFVIDLAEFPNEPPPELILGDNFYKYTSAKGEYSVVLFSHTFPSVGSAEEFGYFDMSGEVVRNGMGQIVNQGVTMLDLRGQQIDVTDFTEILLQQYQNQFQMTMDVVEAEPLVLNGYNGIKNVLQFSDGEIDLYVQTNIYVAEDKAYMLVVSVPDIELLSDEVTTIFFESFMILDSSE